MVVSTRTLINGKRGEEVLIDPCLNDPEYRTQMRFVEEMLRGVVPEVHREGPTLRVEVPDPNDEEAVERAKAIEAALTKAGFEGFLLSRSVVWKYPGGSWHNPCRNAFPAESKV